METAQPRVSFTDLQRMPEDGKRYELYDGEVRVIPSPIPLHQVVVQNISRLLDRYSTEHGGLSLVSPIDIVFTEYNVVQPDVVLFSQARRQLVDFNVAIRHRPDLAIEVLSPSTSAYDRGRKMAMFGRFAVPEYWIVDPALASIEVLILEGSGYREAQDASGEDVVRSVVLAPFTFLAAELFVLP